MGVRNRRDRELANGFRVYRQSNRGAGWSAGFALLGVQYFRYFADSAYGSPAAARRAAEEYATSNCELHEELLALRRRFAVRSNSRSKIPGVSRYEGYGKHGPYWLAYWDDARGRRVSRRFSVGRFGETEAFERAVKAREQAVADLRKRYQQLLEELGLVAGPARKRRARTKRA